MEMYAEWGFEVAFKDCIVFTYQVSTNAMLKYIITPLILPPY
jgi:hypothetical protein